MMPCPTHRSAAALILVVWAIAMLSLLAGGMTFVLRQDLAVATLQKDRVTAHVLARSGVEYAIAAVMDDSTSIDTMEDYCCDDELSMRDVEMTGGVFRVIHGSGDPVPETLYGAEGESSKLNINVATAEQLMALPDMTEPIAHAIIDWRDKDEDPHPLGIERSYYSNLPHPYEIRNAPFRSVRELLLVRDVSPTLLYGEDTNTNGLLDPNEDDGSKTPPDDNADGRLDRGWFAWMTVYSYDLNQNKYGQKRLNLNSADASTLARQLYLEDWAAKSIVKARENSKFKNLTDLLKVERARGDAEDAADSEDSDINFREDDEKDKPITLTIFKRILDDVTLSDDEKRVGLININTASREVMETLPGVNDELAESIVQYRDSVVWFESIGDLLDIEGLTTEVFAKLENHVTLRSNVYRILSEGIAESGLAKASIECVVNRGKTEVPIVLYWRESMP